MADYPLQLADEATVGADGTATLTFTVGPHDRWTVTRVTVDCTVANPMPEVTLYRNAVTRTAILGHTYNGAASTASGSPEHFAPGEHLIVQWTGGDPGASCVATVGGTNEAP